MRVAITDSKQPVDIATQPRGTAPFIVDDRAVKIGFPMSRNAVKTFWDNNDFYPYGMLIPERSWSSNDYRYGYNTQANGTAPPSTSSSGGASSSNPKGKKSSSNGVKPSCSKGA